MFHGHGVWPLSTEVICRVRFSGPVIVYVSRREGRTRKVRITLGVVRGALLLCLIALLNRPILSRVQSRTEPSVLAVVVDESISMRVRDAGEKDASVGRLEAVEQLLAGS